MNLELRTPSEHEEQVQLMNWAAASAPMQTDLRKRIALVRFHSIPNGAAVARQEGARNPGAKQGGKLKAEGLKSSTPDLFLPYPKTDGNIVVAHGLYIEMKKYGEKPRPDQAACLEDLATLGYWTRYFDLWQSAAEFVVGYMHLTRFRPIESALWLNLYLRAKKALKNDNRRVAKLAQ